MWVFRKHESAKMDVQVGCRRRGKLGGSRKWEKKRKIVGVCVCVREREREREGGGGDPVYLYMNRSFFNVSGKHKKQLFIY